MTGLLIVCILYLVVFSLAEGLYQRGVQARITRKITHIGGGLVSAGLPLFISLPAALILGVFF
jgi:hypothetical protein